MNGIIGVFCNFVSCIAAIFSDSVFLLQNNFSNFKSVLLASSVYLFMINISRGL